MGRKIHPNVRKYETEAQRLLKRAMWDRSVTYRRLAELLTDEGLPHTKENLSNKVSRGGLLPTRAW